MQLSNQSPFYTSHSAQEAILILRYFILIKQLCLSNAFSKQDLLICRVFFLFQVRVYTPKRVFQEMEAAKEEYIRATFGVLKDQKILLPKIVESFIKDSGLCQTGLIKMIQQTLPESLRKSIKKCQLGKSRKSIEWIPHNFTFRYLISKELVR